MGDTTDRQDLNLNWQDWWDDRFSSPETTDFEVVEALRQFPFLASARAAQRPPPGHWRTWLFIGGRGSGKTRAGAEWTRFAALHGRCNRIALIGPTLGDVREVMIEGPSGLREIEPDPKARPHYSVSRRRLEWQNGAVGLVFSAEDPESLRGPQFDAAWCDEIGVWMRGETVWNNLQFGLRLGDAPRCVATTTPRPVKLVKRLMSGEAVTTHSATRDNAHHLAPGFVDSVEAAYAGTALARQELFGELLEDLEGALWRRTRPLTEAPAMPETVPETLEGTWLWGGQLWLHFGHFLAESTPRLWGLQAYEGKIDGILFTPKRPRNADLVKRWQWKFLEELAPGLPVRVAKAPTRVERLIVPGQGFGLGKISRGTPEFRTFIAGAFGATISPSGPDKLYISRSKFEFRKGSLVGEGELETQLAAQGYEIFHPQEHDIATQIARYKAASHIIAAEGSAIHLAAMVMGPHQKLAIVVRRRSSATDYIETHLQSFAGVTALSVDALVRSWMPEGERKARHAIGEIDFPSLQNALLAGGFIEPSAQVWENFSKSGVQELLGGKFRPV